METPWGKLDVRDAHLHFFSHRFFSLLTGGRDPNEVCAQLAWTVPPVHPAELATVWAGELDRNFVASAALIASIPGDEESVAAAVASRQDRFHGYWMLNPLAEDAALRLSNALAAGLRTVCLFPAMHRYSMAEDRFAPLWRMAEGTNVFVHCGVLSVGVRKRLGLPSAFDMRFSNPMDLHGVAARHPNVRFIVPHFGAGYFREALMLAGLCSNVYLDTSSSNGWMRYSESALDLEQVFRKALNVAGAKRLLFGTDSSFFPRGWVRSVFEEQMAVLGRIGIDKSDAAAIFGGNLAELQAE